MSGDSGAAHKMNVVRPFPARVVRQERAERMVTPMFDALDSTATDRLPQTIDLDAYDESVAALYVYRQRRGSHSHVGVVCDIRAEAFVNGQVRGHESVRPDRVEALVRHFATRPERVELVALLHRAGPVLASTVANTCRTPPLLRFTGPDGLEQAVWRVAAGPATAALSGELSEAGHYIADGHHRVAASLAEWEVAGKPSEAGLLCVIYPMDGLRLSAFHRRIAGPVDPAGLLALLAQEFDVREVSGAAAASGSFGVYTGGRWFDATFRGLRHQGPGGLDVSILHDRVLAPVVGSVASPGSSVEIAVRTSLVELTARCDEDGGALFTLAPPPLDVLTGLADRGEVMPPKTTYFEPKPYAGIFLR